LNFPDTNLAVGIGPALRSLKSVLGIKEYAERLTRQVPEEPRQAVAVA
jgi:hypothetical protein